MYSLDTLRTARDLEDAGLERRHAEAIASAIGQADEQAATKADIVALRSEFAALRSEFRWVFGFQSAVILTIVAHLLEII